MKLFAFSDTHGRHDDIRVPKCDVAIFAGDATSEHNPLMNQFELRAFLEWYQAQTVDTKIFVAGNHDTSIDRFPGSRQQFKDAGITYVENQYAEVGHLSMFGSPYTRPWGKQDWAFTRGNHKLGQFWAKVGPVVDIVVAHSMPLGILDSTDCIDTGKMIHVGCKPLAKALQKIKPLLYLGGHIHNGEAEGVKIHNYGRLATPDTVFYNCSAVTDRDFGGKVNQGHLIDLGLNMEDWWEQYGEEAEIAAAETGADRELDYNAEIFYQALYYQYQRKVIRG